jgi:ABC-type nitrate/sulfonate/bicarbonate transport system permease component
MNPRSALRRYCVNGVRLGAFSFLASWFLATQSPVWQNTLLPEPAQITSARGSIPFTRDFTVSLG